MSVTLEDAAVDSSPFAQRAKEETGKAYEVGGAGSGATIDVSRVSQTDMGQPPPPVRAWTAVIYRASTSGRSSRSSLMFT
jgi:hypothetical protein